MIDRLKEMYMRDRMLVLMPAMSVALFLTIIPFVIIPQIQLFSEVRTNIATGKERLGRLEEKQAKLQGVQISELQRQFVLSSQGLPSSKDIGSLLVTLDLLSQKHNVTLSDFSASLGALDEAPSGGAGAPSPSLSVAVAVIGDLESIKEFLKSIAESLPIVSVSDISFSKTGASISFVFYYKPIVTSLPSIDAPLPDLSRFGETIATLSARSSASGPSSLQIPNLEDQNVPAKPQIFNRPNPFF